MNFLQHQILYFLLIYLITENTILGFYAPMIINRTGQKISVEYMLDKKPLFEKNNSITLNGSSDHKDDEMVLIPSNLIANPNSTNNATYKNSATSANITIGDTKLEISSFAKDTSYVIKKEGSNFVVKSGLANYDNKSGNADYGSPNPSGPETGF
ncbi:MAG: hypothetical protein ACXWL2_01920 [Candidatus Chromulinivorax sp.]